MPKDIDLHLNVNENIGVKINIFKDKIQEQIQENNMLFHSLVIDEFLYENFNLIKNYD